MSITAVIDCSVAASWFIPDEKSSEKDRVLDDIISGELIMIVPDLWWYEITNVVKSAFKRNRITIEEANRIIFFLKGIEKEVYSSDWQGQPGILNHSISTDLSVYDAAYFHLAVTTGAFLITSDKELLKLKASHENILSPEEYAERD